MTKRASDFALFTLFCKGVNAYAKVLKYNHIIRNEARMHLNKVVTATDNFEKDLHRMLGDDLAKSEDDIHSEMVAFMERIYRLPEEDRTRFLDHCNQFES